MKSQENEISKKMKSPKKQMKYPQKRNLKKKKKIENKTFSEFNQCRCHTMSVPDNVRI